MSNLKLLTSAFSPYGQRVETLLLEKMGQPWTFLLLIFSLFNQTSNKFVPFLAICKIFPNLVTLGPTIT